MMSRLACLFVESINAIESNRVNLLVALIVAIISYEDSILRHLVSTTDCVACCAALLGA
jgi:hypothetical protein